MLDYENQMFLDILNDDGLIVSAKGLGLEDVFLSLLKVYSDPGNLVIVLGTTGQEESFYTDRLTADGVKPVPRVITAESGSGNERKNLYLQGGVLFLTPRTLVVDLLKERLPIDRVTGVLVYRAHTVITNCQLAFALRLYRQKNKTGFVKALSNSAQAFTMGFCQVTRVMKMLFVKHLYLWPRFQAIVQSSLGSCKPLVVEMHVQLTPAMTRVQNAVLELMAFTVRELKRINPTFDFDELTVENAIAKSFHKILQSQLDTVWHRLSAKTKLLVADLKILRVILNYLTRYDCITFNAFLRSFRTQTYALNSSGWLLLDAANVLFQTANQRTLQGNTTNHKPRTGNKARGKGKKALSKLAPADLDEDDVDSPPCLQRGDFRKRMKKAVEPVSDDDMFASDEEGAAEEGAVEEGGAKETGGEQGGLDPEPSPKWVVLKQILSEIRELSRTRWTDASTPDKVLILVQDKRTAKQLQDFLLYGAREMLLRLHGDAAVKLRTATAGRRYEEAPNARSPTKLFHKYQPRGDQPTEMLLNTQMLADESKPEQEAVKQQDAPTGCDAYRDVYILSQKTDEAHKANYELVADKIEQLNVSAAEPSFQPPVLIIQTFKTDGNPLSLPQTLDEARPGYVVMYDIDVAAIRRIEVYQSNLPATQVHVYFVVFAGSVEEQAYLTALRREKEAFEMLIKEKATMVIPEDQDGREESCDALSRDASKPSETVNSRRGGGAVEPSPRQRTIIVDMREFNSELPAMIHRRGIDVDPVTLQIGDYILSPDICVERKSISDLIGSLNNGRLYNQAKAMTRYYTSPMLLIEFDQNKPMTLQGNYYISNDVSTNDVSARLILLTLHFPQLKLVWSPSPYATAQLFEELKQIREEPDAVKAASVGADLEQDLDVSEKYNPGIHDLVARLPGVTTKNIHSILNHGQSLDHMLSYDKAQLSAMTGNSQEADWFHDGLHKVYNPAAETEAKRGGARWRGRGSKRTL